MQDGVSSPRAAARILVLPFAYDEARRSRVRSHPGQQSEMMPVHHSGMMPVTDSDFMPVTFCGRSES